MEAKVVRPFRPAALTSGNAALAIQHHQDEDAEDYMVRAMEMERAERAELRLVDPDEY